LSPDCQIVLALGTIETTRLALESFGTPRMGRNLMAHLRSNLTCRIKRSALKKPIDSAKPDYTLPKELEAAALLVRGSNGASRYHFPDHGGRGGSEQHESRGCDVSRHPRLGSARQDAGESGP
jgi:hypothetical protein